MAHELSIDPPLVLPYCARESTHFKSRIEQEVDRPEQGMSHLILVKHNTLLHQVIDSLTHTALLLSECLSLKAVQDVKVKLIIVDINAKTQMVHEVREYSLKLDSDIDACAALLSNLSIPLINGLVQVLLENFDHIDKALFVEHMADGFTAFFPFRASTHCDESVSGQGIDYALNHVVLHDELVLLSVPVLHQIGTVHVDYDFVTPTCGHNWIL